MESPPNGKVTPAGRNPGGSISGEEEMLPARLTSATVIGNRDGVKARVDVLSRLVFRAGFVVGAADVVFGVLGFVEDRFDVC